MCLGTIQLPLLNRTLFQKNNNNNNKQTKIIHSRNYKSTLCQANSISVFHKMISPCTWFVLKKTNKQTNKHYVLMQHKIRWGRQSCLFRWHNMKHTIIHKQHAYNTNRTPTSPASSEMSLPNCQQIAPCQASFTHYTLGNTTAESNFLHLLLLISITYFNSNACDVARTEVHI